MKLFICKIMSFELKYSDEEVIKICGTLSDHDTCTRCILRFLGVQVSLQTNSIYQNPEQFLSKFRLTTCSSEDNKKIKPNTCPVCLGSFNEAFITKCAEYIRNECKLNEYDYEDYFINISWPKATTIRGYAMYLYLKQQFPELKFDNFFDADGYSIENLGRISRCISSDIISKTIGKVYHQRSHLSILLNFSYADDEIEIEPLKNGKNKVISRNSIPDQLKQMDTKHLTIPPKIPDCEIFIESASVTADSIYLGGRYLKFTRTLCQTPWIIDGQKIAEHNLQEIVFNSIASVLNVETGNLTFCASGREDMDVRMLGTGRPFYIKIDNPKTRQITFEMCRKIEKNVVDTKLAAVEKLQLLNDSNDIQIIKIGEETKRKWYRAICKTDAPDIAIAIKSLNGYFENSVEIVQKTPIRVLHRRTLMDRKKIIHALKATLIENIPNLFVIDVQTQAGTYVKELVNGDFNRTVPNLAHILGYNTDLIALDCTNIDLEWPPIQINNKNNTC